MSDLLRKSVKKLPKPVIHAMGSAVDWFDRLKDFPSACFHPWRRKSIRALRGLKNSHKGERCFIIGNGPSLRKMDLSRLKNEFTFGMNRIYMLFPEIGFQTDLFLAVNDLVIEQCAEDIHSLSMPKFIAWRSHKHLQYSTSTHFLHTSYTGPKFTRDITGRLWEGATVTYTALQVAYYLGFSTAILIGVDHNFVTKGEPNTTVTSQGDDPNHFSGAYFGKGFRWQLPDLETSEKAYRMAKAAYEKDGRRVLDATVDGKLNVFDKVDFHSLFIK